MTRRSCPTKRSYFPFFALGFALLFNASMVGCRGETEEAPPFGSAGAPGDGDGNAAPITDSPFAKNDADELFDASTVPVFSVTLPEEEWLDLQANATLEEYKEARLTYAGEDVGTVGIRYKGSYGSLLGCFDGAGQLTCEKLSLKLKFNEYDPNKRFYGMKRLNFHGLARDPSKLHDKISYKVYRDMGIIAPRSTWARIEVNGGNQGLFALVEQIDGRFTDDRWPDDGNGNLYKEVWPDSSDPQTYEDHLETNEGMASHDTFLEFQAAIHGAAPADQLSALGTYMDVGKLYDFVATSDALGNWDGITAFYCSGSGCANHNYYMYQHEVTDTFTLIPWDLDSTLSLGTPFDHVPHWTTPGDCDARYPVFGDLIDVQSAGCNPVFEALASDRSRYEAALDRLLSGPFDVDAIKSDIDTYVAFIEDEIALDPTSGGVSGWLANVDRLKSDLDLLKQKIEALRDNSPMTPLYLDSETTTDFEGKSALQAALGIGQYANTGSSSFFGLSNLMPLGGEQDIEMSFTFRDEGTKPWSQWSALIFRFESGSADLRGHTGIRFKVRTDSTRKVRLDLGSPAQPGEDGGAKFGWDFSGTPASTTVSLAFADAEIPSWATSQGEVLAEVQAAVRDLTFLPEANRPTSGLLGAGVEDPGFIRLDDIEFY